MAQTATMQAPAQSQPVQGASDTQFAYPEPQGTGWSGSQAPTSMAVSGSNQSPSADGGGRSESAAPSSGTTGQGGAKQEELFPHAKKAWFSYYHDHRNQVIFASIGLIVAAGFLIIGFWPTLLLAVFITVGVLYGRYKDGDRKTVATVKGIISRLD